MLSVFEDCSSKEFVSTALKAVIVVTAFETWVPHVFADSDLLDVYTVHCRLYTLMKTTSDAKDFTFHNPKLEKKTDANTKSEFTTLVLYNNRKKRCSYWAFWIRWLRSWCTLSCQFTIIKDRQKIVRKWGCYPHYLCNREIGFWF